MNIHLDIKILDIMYRVSLSIILIQCHCFVALQRLCHPNLVHWRRDVMLWFLLAFPKVPSLSLSQASSSFCLLSSIIVLPSPCRFHRLFGIPALTVSPYLVRSILTGTIPGWSSFLLLLIPLLVFLLWEPYLSWSSRLSLTSLYDLFIHLLSLFPLAQESLFLLFAFLWSPFELSSSASQSLGLVALIMLLHLLKANAHNCITVDLYCFESQNSHSHCDMGHFHYYVNALRH